MIEQAKIDIADSIFFHAHEINSEIYNYAHALFREKLETKKEFRDRVAPPKDKPKRSILKTIIEPETSTLLNVMAFMFLVLVLYRLGLVEDWMLGPFIKQLPGSTGSRH